VKTGIQYLISFSWIPAGIYPVLDTGQGMTFIDAQSIESANSGLRQSLLQNSLWLGYFEAQKDLLRNAYVYFLGKHSNNIKNNVRQGDLKKMVEINPKRITGCWTEGFALDFHTLSSEYIGDDEYGHPQFDTKRSEIGELLYRLKYRKDNSVLDDIITTVSQFIKSINWTVDLIVCVPPSRKGRKF